jgi:hypothetical protein
MLNWDDCQLWTSFLRKANLPVNFFFSGKLAFSTKKKGQKWPHGNLYIEATKNLREV